MQVIRLRRTGQTYTQISEHTGLSRTGVFDICKRHEAAVRKLITDKPPDQLKMPYVCAVEPHCGGPID